METCKNCGDKIGALQTPHLWQQNVVCEPCYKNLNVKRNPEVVNKNSCPKCGGHNVQALHVAHAAGTSNIRGTAMGLVDIAEFSGVSQTNLAAIARPLQPKPLAWSAIIAVACVLLAVFLNLMIWSNAPYDTAERDASGKFVDSSGQPFPRDLAGNLDYRANPHYGRAFINSVVVSAIFLGIAYFFAMRFSKNSHFNDYELPKHIGSWQKRWICNQCGHIFTPKVKEQLAGYP